MLNSPSVYFALNIISGIVDCLTVLICLVFLSLLILYLIRNQWNQNQITGKMSILLCLNTLCVIITKSVVQLIHVTWPTLRADLKQMQEFDDSVLCRARGLALWSLIGVLYWSYTLQATCHFTRLIHPNRPWLHSPKIYLTLLIPLQFLLSIVPLLPIIFVFDAVHLLADDAYCTVSCDNFRIMIYLGIIIFFAPMSIICVFYFWIVFRIRHLPFVYLNSDRYRRDYRVIRRIVFNILLLSLVALPYVIVFIIDIHRGHFDPLIYRLQWISSSLSSLLFSIVLPWISTRLRQLIKLKRIGPAAHQR